MIQGLAMHRPYNNKQCPCPSEKSLLEFFKLPPAQYLIDSGFRGPRSRKTGRSVGVNHIRPDVGLVGVGMKAEAAMPSPTAVDLVHTLISQL